MALDRPDLECDLIMKGGVTSGVVYPAALTTLMARYRLRGVGGSSAGAIAAAVAAAAEFGRATGHAPALAEVDALARELKTNGEFFRGLFHPQSRGKQLLDAVFDARRQAAQGPWWGPSRVLSSFRFMLRVPTAAAGLGLGLAFGVALWWVSGGVLDVLGVLALLTLATIFTTLGGGLGLGAHAWLVWRWLGDAEASGMGLCTGYQTDARDSPEILAHTLTGWLDLRLTAIAGKPVLTFADLAAHDIALRMVTTNLNRRHPLVIPRSADHDDSDMTACLARVEDLRRLFPAPYVDAMIARDRALEPRLYRQYAYGEEYVKIDFDDSLPVLVAVRMSLSFPALLTAVRLFGLSEAGAARLRNAPGARITAADLEHRLFSDGGIASNFPLNLFDSWLPRRPTFGITLRDGAPCKEGADGREMHDAGHSVRLLRASDVALSMVEPAPIDDFAEFLGAIFDTARNYRDNAQTSMASYRERIVQVFLAPGEGGLTLDMSTATIDALIERGARAADALVERYADGDGLAEHQWVRLRVLGAHLERLATAIFSSYGGRQALEAHLGELLDAQKAAPWYATWAPERADDAKRSLTTLLDFLDDWSRSNQGVVATSEIPPLWDFEPPHPDGALRVATEL